MFQVPAGFISKRGLSTNISTLQLYKMDVQQGVQTTKKVIKNRPRGSESVIKERKRCRNSGLEHTNYKGIIVPAKTPPSHEVSYLNL